MKTINAFLDLSFKGSDSELCRYRLLYLSKTNFQNIGNNDNTIRNFLANILTNDESNRGQSCVAEMISLLLSICV